MSDPHSEYKPEQEEIDLTKLTRLDILGAFRVMMAWEDGDKVDPELNWWEDKKD